jgi:hypothetical protein
MYTLILEYIKKIYPWNIGSYQRELETTFNYQLNPNSSHFFFWQKYNMYSVFNLVLAPHVNRIKE